MPDRRTFLGNALALPALAMMPAAAAPALAARAIPTDGRHLPVVGLGTWQTFDVGSDAAARTRLGDVLARFAELGGALVDSSPMYGNSESVLGDLAAQHVLRERLFLATKVWTSGREAGIQQMQASLRRMRTQRMDLMQVHNLLDWRTHLDTLQAWRKEGRVRYLGITHYHAGAHAELEKLLRSRQWDFVQVNYSIAETEAGERLLPVAADLGVAVIVNRPFAQGALFSRVRGLALPDWAAEFDCGSWAQFFLKWILSDPAVTCVIPASRKAEHTRDNMAAGLGRLPDAATRRRMAAWFESAGRAG